MAHRHDPAGAGQGALQECRFNPVPGIVDPTHVNVSPNPGAALSTSPVRPDFSNSRGFATASSNGHSCVRNDQASSGSPMIATTSASPATTTPGPRTCAAGMFNPRLVDLQASSVPLCTQSIDRRARHPEPHRSFRGAEGFVTSGSLNDERPQPLRHTDPAAVRLALCGRRFKRDGHGEARLPRMLHDELPGAFRQHRNSLHEKPHRLCRRSARSGHFLRAPNLPPGIIIARSVQFVKYVRSRTMAAALPSVRTTPPATLAVELIPLCLRLQRLPNPHRRSRPMPRPGEHDASSRRCVLSEGSGTLSPSSFACGHAPARE